MGWYLRKSLRLGPFRLNLSKSGVGVSAGVKGLRIGAGPRGSYIHGGRGGLYFHQRLGGPADRHRPSCSSPIRPNDASAHEAGAIRTAGAAQLVDPSAQNLLREINRCLQLTPWVPFVIGGGTVATAAALLAYALQHWAWAFACVPCLAITVFGSLWARARDFRLKTIHLWFDLSEDAGRRFKVFEHALEAMASSDRMWRVTAQEATDDWKRNAGANSLVSRTPVRLKRRLPPYFDSNLRPYSLAVSAQTLYFFPDQVLVYEGSHAGAVSYDSLEIDVSNSEFRETDGIPDDANVVEHTWRYVNKKGGPDRRFSNNPQIPVCRYEKLVLRSQTGLNIHLMLSKLGVGATFREAEAQVLPLKREAADEATSLSDNDQLAFEQWGTQTCVKKQPSKGSI